MVKKTNAIDRREYVRQQRIAGQYEPEINKAPSRDMSFINREGNIIRPTRENPWPDESVKPLYYARAKPYETVKKRSRYQSYRNASQENYGIISLAGILGGLFFLSTSITGNVIRYATVMNSGVLGAVLLVVGLTTGFFWVQNKKSK